MINGQTQVLGLMGDPLHTVKSPLIYNPYFEHQNINAALVPFGVAKADLAQFMPAFFKLSNAVGALITMPHKVNVLELLDEVSPTAEIAGACNAVRRSADGRLQGDMFDGEGFVRGVLNKGLVLRGKRALIVGCGGVGCAIAASLAAAGVKAMSLYDVQPASAAALAERLKKHYSSLDITLGSNDPTDHDLVVNATPMGMNEGDDMPMDVSRIHPDTFVGEVVMKAEMTAFLQAAQAKGCPIQVGIDMLFEQIAAYLDFFGHPQEEAEVLRQMAQIRYA